MYRMDAVKVGTLDSGEIDYEELRGALAANAPHRPAIVNVNIGTTVKGAVDDLDKVLDILRVGAMGGKGGGAGRGGGGGGRHRLAAVQADVAAAV